MANIHVRFTGACTLFPLGKHWSERPGGARVVLANGGGANATEPIPSSQVRNAAHELKRHVAYMYFDTRSIEGLKPDVLRSSSGVVVWLFDKERIALSSDSSTPFQVLWDTAADDEWKSLRHLLELEDIVGEGKARPHAAVFDSTVALPAAIRALVTLGAGRLEVSGIQKDVMWKVPTFTGGEIMAPVAHELLLTLEGASYLQIDSISIDHGSRSLRLIPLADVIEVTVGNLCPDHNPLRWPLDPQAGGRDEDFEWHYQVLNSFSIDKIKQRVGTGGPPVPEPIPAAGGGINCFPAGGGTGP